VDLQRFAGCLAGGEHRLVHQVEGLADGGQHSLGGRGHDDLARLAQEQLFAQVVLEQLDLVADCGLGHAELVACAGETHVTGHRLEHAQGIERKFARQFHA